MFYPATTHKSILQDITLISVVISEDGIKPKRKCKHGFCISDGGICGHYEGLSLDGDAFCSREEMDGA